MAVLAAALKLLEALAPVFALGMVYAFRKAGETQGAQAQAAQDAAAADAVTARAQTAIAQAEARAPSSRNAVIDQLNKGEF